MRQLWYFSGVCLVQSCSEVLLMNPLILCCCLFLVSLAVCKANRDYWHKRQRNHFSITLCVTLWLNSRKSVMKSWRPRRIFFFFAINCDLLSSLDNVIGITVMFQSAVVRTQWVRSGAMGRLWHNYKERTLKRMKSRSFMLACVRHVECMWTGTF